MLAFAAKLNFGKPKTAANEIIHNPDPTKLELRQCQSALTSNAPHHSLNSMILKYLTSIPLFFKDLPAILPRNL